jgi:hypothetical protein
MSDALTVTRWYAAWILVRVLAMLGAFMLCTGGWTLLMAALADRFGSPPSGLVTTAADHALMLIYALTWWTGQVAGIALGWAAARRTLLSGWGGRVSAALLICSLFAAARW